MERFGRYIALKKIGSGGMAEVFLARSEWAQGTEKLLVIKKIHPSLSENVKFIDMFVDEASVAIRLNHVNIVQVYTFEQFETDHILAMEYVDGFDLFALESIARSAERPFPQGLAAFIAAEVAKGLDYAHSRLDDRGQPLDIVHRDVSPQNILISREGEVKVTDFGVARARWLHEEVLGTIKGKFGYMAPEQALGSVVDRRCDVYALGVVLYEMLAGEPFVVFSSGVDPLEVIHDVVPLRPSRKNPAVSETLDDIVLRCMARKPEDRFQTARELALALARFLHREPEISDSHALQSWVTEIVPKSEPLPSIPGTLAPEFDLTAAPTPIVTPDGEDEVTTIYQADRDDEQRILVVVSGKIEGMDNPEYDGVEREISGLINEMAFKADGVLEQNRDQFTVFLGILHSSNEDAISGIRLAHDVLDALRAISVDRGMNVRVKLTVTQGVVRCMSRMGEAKPKFVAGETLARKTGTLFEHVDWNVIAADDRVFRLARREYHFKRILEGISKTSKEIRAYRILAAKSRAEKSLAFDGSAPFYGRDQELAALGEALHSALNGRTTLRTLIGEVGIGKSRLVNQFTKSIPRNTVRVHSTECLFAERDKPLSSAVAIIRALLGLGEGETETTVADRLIPILRDAPLYAARQEAFFRQLIKSPEGIWAERKADRRDLVQRTAAGLGVLISLITKETATLLIIDNAQWLDGPSVDILVELAGVGAAAAVLVILVGQPSTLRGRDVPNLQTIEVGELDDEFISRMIFEKFGHSEGMKTLTGQIVNRVQGNPFFAGEIIDSLVEQDILAEHRDANQLGYRQVRPGSIRLPATMEGIARSRLDALPAGQRGVLRTAAAMGADFTIAGANAMLGRDTERDVLAMVKKAILVPIGDESGKNTAYRFKQHMMRQAAYESLSKSDRYRIHHTLASQLISARQVGEAVSNVRIAWHLDNAGETESAGKHYLDAGNAALEIYSDREALKLYDRALKRLGDDSPHRFAALSKRERVLRDLLRHKERRRDLKEMERIADAKGDLAGKAYAATRLAQIDYDKGDCLAAAENLGVSLELAARSQDTAQQIEALRLLAYVAVEEGHLVRGLDCCNRALGLLGEGRESSGYLRGRALGVKGFVLLKMGDLDGAAGPLARALVLFRRLKKRRNESQVLSNLALLAQARGDLTEAMEFLRSAMRIDLETRDVSARGQKLAALGMIQLELGDFDRADANFSAGIAICEEKNEHIGTFEAALGFAELHILRGDYPSARAALEKVSRSRILERSRLLLVRHRQLFARALVGSGMSAAAGEMAEEATRVALEAGMTGEAVYSGVIHGFVLAESGMAGEALLVTRRAMDLLSTLGKVRSAEQVWWWHALTLYRVGDIYRAGRALGMARKEVLRRKSLFPNSRFTETYVGHPITRAIERGFDSTE